MSHGGRGRTVTLIALALGAAIYFLVPMSLPFSAVSMAVGLAIVLLVGEPMVEGLKELGRRTGVSDHIIGIASSIASNLPEAVMTLFMIASPHPQGGGHTHGAAGLGVQRAAPGSLGGHGDVQGRCRGDT